MTTVSKDLRKVTLAMSAVFVLIITDKRIVRTCPGYFVPRRFLRLDSHELVQFTVVAQVKRRLQVFSVDDLLVVCPYRRRPQGLGEKDLLVVSVIVGRDVHRPRHVLSARLPDLLDDPRQLRHGRLVALAVPPGADVLVRPRPAHVVYGHVADAVFEESHFLEDLPAERVQAPGPGLVYYLRRGCGRRRSLEKVRRTL